MELLEHRRVANGARGFHVAPFGRSALQLVSISASQLLFGRNIRRSVER
jgi:hypothetical protein